MPTTNIMNVVQKKNSKYTLINTYRYLETSGSKKSNTRNFKIFQKKSLKICFKKLNSVNHNMEIIIIQNNKR
jgi:hypothetical protein